MTVTVTSPAWGISTGLSLPDRTWQEQFESGVERSQSYDIEGALTAWLPLADALSANGQWREAAWLRCRIGWLLIEPVGTGGDRWPKEWVHGSGVVGADHAFEEAARLARSNRHTRIEAMVHDLAGRAWGEHSPVQLPVRMSFGRSRRALTHAVDLFRRSAPDSLLLASSLQSLGLLWAHNDDPAVRPDRQRARTFLRQALAIRRQLIPNTHDEAIARLALERVELTGYAWCPGCAGPAPSAAERLDRLKSLRRAGQILHRVPGGVEIRARAAMQAAFASASLNDFASVVEFATMAVPLLERIEEATSSGERPPPANCIPCFDLHDDLNNLAVALNVAGRGKEAEIMARRAMAVSKRRGVPTSAWTYDNLAHAAGLQGRFGAQQEHLLAALDVRKKRGAEDEALYSYVQLGSRLRLPGSAVLLRHAVSIADGLPVHTDDARRTVENTVCTALITLLERGEADTSETRRVHTQCSRWEHPNVGDEGPAASHLMTLSRVALLRGDHKAALSLAQQALRLSREVSRAEPLASTGVASALLHVGRAQCASGNASSGIRALREARRIFERVFPRADTNFEILEALGRCERRVGRPRQAAVTLERLLQSADAFGDGRFRSPFVGSQWAAVSTELVGAWIESGEPAAAFAALEEGRARALRMALAEHDVARPGLPDSLRTRRADLWLEYDLTQRMLQELPPSAPRAKTVKLLADLAAISAKLDVIAADARRTRVTPRPRHRLEDIARALPPGALLLEYLVESDRTHIFAIAPRTDRSSLDVITLPITRGELEAAVVSFVVGAESRDTAPEDSRRHGAALYDMLVRPVESAVERSSRLIIVPDGPLYDLPFAALVRTTAAGSRYLIEGLPITVARSASAAVALRPRPSPAATPTIVAVGDVIGRPTVERQAYLRPRTRGERVRDDAHSDADEAERAGTDDGPLRGGPASGRLPGSRREVEAIARLFGSEATTILGRDASETRLKTMKPPPRILHLATHAIVNSVLPLNSGLRLSAAASASSPLAEGTLDNGFLQAWEIVDQMQLDSELVTLSSCESGRGPRLAGEGTLSLAYAFHLAGARSVVSALWSIDDEATAVFMTTFYGGLRRGLAKDEALRRAQLEFIAGSNSRWRSPAYWGAFVLSGDWR